MRIRAKDGDAYTVGPLGVLALVSIIDQIDTSILRGVLPLLKAEWGLSDFALGMLGFAFLLVNSIATIPAGWLADRFTRTKIIGWTLLSWSALSALSAAAVNFITLFGARASLGFGQAIDDPASTSLLGDFYPAKVRGRIFSWQQIASTAGGGIGIGLGGFIGAALGWRWAFLLVGMPGSLLAFVVFRLREPVRGEAEGMTAETAPEPAAAQMSAREFTVVAWRELVSELRMIFAIRTMRYILVGVGTLLFTVSGVGYWLTVYHERYSGMSPAQAAGVTAGILTLGGVAGTLWGGSIADRVYGRVRGGRIVVVAAGIMGCTGIFLLSFNMPLIGVRIAMQFVGVFAIASAFPGLRASMMDVIPAESRGVGVSAFALVSTVFGTALAPPLVGVLSDLTSLLGAYYIVTPPIFVGTLILLRARETIEADAMAMLQAITARTAPATPAAEPAEPETEPT